MVAADVVTADGRLLVTSEQEHPDLYWALRGGGGNFGVVTSLEFRAHPVGPDVSMAIVFYPIETAARVLRVFREYMASAPDEVSAIGVLWSAGHGEPFPPEAQGKPVAAIAACYSGAVERGESANVNPSVPVRFGGPTTDEMDLGFLSYALVEENKRPSNRWQVDGDD